MICFAIKNQSINFVQNNYDHFKDLQLADSGSNDDFELLAGSDFYWSVVTGNVLTGKIGEHVGVETKFVWLLNGLVTKNENILVRFRIYSIALTLGIEKTFLQIGINKSDRDYLPFL